MPVKDRLAELQQKSKYCRDLDKAEETEMKPLTKKTAANSDGDFEAFLETAQELAANINKVATNLSRLKALQDRVLNEPSRTERERHQAALNDLVDENKKLGRQIQKVIKEEQARNEKFDKRTGASARELSELHIRKTQIGTHSKRFLDIWTEYNNVQVKFRDRTKAALVKNIKITNNQLTDEQIEEKIDNNDISVFSSAIIQETAAAKEQLVAIENRHAEILNLERGIVEIHDMFIDLSNLVSMQGEMVDRIEDHINRAGMDVEQGRKSLKKAEEHKITGNKLKICLIGIGIVVILIIILVVLAEFGAFSSRGSSGGTTVVQHIYNFPNGTSLVSDEKLPQLVEKPPPSPTDHQYVEKPISTPSDLLPASNSTSQLLTTAA